MTAAEIVSLLERKGITAAEEYFPSETAYPYAVVLEPQADVDMADMGRCMARLSHFKIELYTHSKHSPEVAIFKKAIYENIPCGEFTEGGESYGMNSLYVTTIEFELYEE